MSTMPQKPSQEKETREPLPLRIAKQRFLADVGSIPKKRKNPFTGSMYASWDDIWQTIQDHLITHELTLDQYLDVHGVDDTFLVSVLTGPDGKPQVSEVPLADFLPPEHKGGMQTGAAITYARRYSAVILLGLTGADLDDDTAGEIHTERMITERTIDLIKEELVTAGIDEEAALKRAQEKYGVDTWSALSASQGAAILSLIRRRADGSKK